MPSVFRGRGAVVGLNHFKNKKDVILNLGNYLFEFNHLRKRGGLNYQTPFDKLEKVLNY